MALLLQQQQQQQQPSMTAASRRQANRPLLVGQQHVVQQGGSLQWRLIGSTRVLHLLPQRQQALISLQHQQQQQLQVLRCLLVSRQQHLQHVLRVLLQPWQLPQVLALLSRANSRLLLLLQQQQQQLQRHKQLLQVMVVLWAPAAAAGCSQQVNQLEWLLSTSLTLRGQWGPRCHQQQLQQLPSCGCCSSRKPRLSARCRAAGSSLCCWMAC